MSRTTEIVTDPNASLEAIEAYGYKLVTWSDFVNTSDLPEGLLARAGEVTADRLGDRKWVIYDPSGNHEDWLLIGYREEIIKDTVFDLIALEPPEGPLSPEALGEPRSGPSAAPTADLVSVTKAEWEAIVAALNSEPVTLLFGAEEWDLSEKQEQLLWGIIERENA